jgi:hypothetical protein
MWSCTPAHPSRQKSPRNAERIFTARGIIRSNQSPQSQQRFIFPPFMLIVALDHRHTLLNRKSIYCCFIIMSEQCIAPADLVGGLGLFPELPVTTSLPPATALLLLLTTIWLSMDKVQNLHVFYHVKIALSICLPAFPLITVEMSAAESTDNGHE